MYKKGSAKADTTISAHSATAEPERRLRVVGYVRVSTDTQAQEGVSLDAQRERIRCYCKASGFRLVHLVEDDISARSLERPGLTTALRLLDQGKADALLVVKLDRLTRSVLDLGSLLQRYFLQEQHYLLSVTESLDTRNAMGRFVLYILALVAQWEREAISERTRDSMRYLQSQGVFIGRPPYGYRFAAARASDGRRHLEVDPEEQLVIARIVEMHEAGIPREKMCATLDSDRVRAPGGEKWHRAAIISILKRAGKIPARVRAYRSRKPRQIQRDKKQARARAKQLRSDGLSLRDIASQLLKEQLYPPRGERWHAATVAELLAVKDATETAARAKQLRAAGHSLREVGRQLLYEGHLPPSGGYWLPRAIAAMTTEATEDALL